MASYKDVTWVDDQILDVNSLNQMTSNDRYLFDNMPRMKYGAFSVNRTTGLKVACGIVAIGPSTSPYIHRNVYFGNFFTQGTKPVVVLTQAGQGGITWTLGGAGGSGFVPDHRGFSFTVYAHPWWKNKKNFYTTNYMHWIAIGY